MKFDCPECFTRRSLKRGDTRSNGGVILKIYKCEICKESFESKERLIGKARSIKLNNRKYRK